MADIRQPSETNRSLLRHAVLPGLALAFIAGLNTAPVKSQADATDAKVRELSAERIVLRGANGKAAGVFQTTAGGAQVTLHDAEQKPRLVLAVGADGPGVLLLGPDGGAGGKGVHASLTVDGKGVPSLLLWGEGRKPLATLKVGQNGKEAQLFLLNDQGKGTVLPRRAEKEAAESPLARRSGDN